MPTEYVERVLRNQDSDDDAACDVHWRNERLEDEEE